jgi:hypothetical protein
LLVSSKKSKFFCEVIIFYLKRIPLQNFKINFQEIPWESPLPGARFKAFEQDGTKLRLVEFTSEFIEPDWCRKGHIGYVLSGSMKID